MRSDRGAGLIGTIGGVLVFLVLLTFAVQLLFNLYATSAVTAAAHDAAHMVASGDLDHDDPVAMEWATADAEAAARSLLGRYGERASFSWAFDDDHVTLTVTATHPPLAVHHVSGVFGLNEVVRSVTVRREQLR